VDERKVELALELSRRYPEDPEAAQGPPLVLRTGESELITEISEERLSELAVDDLHLGLVRELGFQSYMGVPLVSRGRTLGVISFVVAESGRRYGPADLALAEELARRASTAIENAQLYREAEERAQAARVLETVADGVFLVDIEGIVRIWNRAAEAITNARDALELEEAMHRKLLEVIVEESTRLADIVNDLLLASQLDADRLEMRVEPCDAHAIAAGVLDAARTHLPEGTRVSLDSGEDVPRVAADEGQLRQVLTNLIDNAVKYSPTGGDVQVRVEAAGEYVRFTVADEGLGIPPAEQSRIFEKFYRLDPDMTGGIGGTGLGL